MVPIIDDASSLYLQREESIYEKSHDVVLSRKKSATFETLPPIPTSSTPTPRPPPDGGLRAWSQVLLAHLVIFNTWGYISSFGIFQPYYVEVLNRSASDVSWVGSIQIFLVFFVGIFSGRATDAGYCRPVIATGCFLQVLGIFMTSLSTEYWQLFLAQGICQGLGNGLLFCPVVALVSTYFSKRKTLAISLSACGGGTGGTVFPLIAQQLLPRVGFAWAVRVMGFVVLANSAVIVALLRTRIPPRKTGPLIEWTAFKEPPFVLFSAGMFFVLWATYYAYYYVRPFALSVVSMPQSTSFGLLLLLNGVGIPGRLVPALLADTYTGALNMLIPTALSAGILLFAWTAIDHATEVWIFVVFFGYFGAGIQSLFPSTCASLTTDPQKAGIRIGMGFSVVSIASMTGPPLAGRLVDAGAGSYLGAQVWGGAFLVSGAVLLVLSRTARVGWRLRVRI